MPGEPWVESTPDSDFTEFIRQQIRTVWAVEVLLVLMADPERSWTAGDLERELRANHYLVSDVLSRFCASGLALVDPQDAYHFAPANPVIERLCHELRDAYR